MSLTFDDSGPWAGKAVALEPFRCSTPHEEQILPGKRLTIQLCGKTESFTKKDELGHD